MNSSYPLVTVFTLIYNTNPKFVIEAIESVRANNYPNLQHIIIDDCSSNPEPKRVVKEWIKNEGYSCEFYEHETNYGLCKTLNHVLELAKGKYIFGCSDDILLENRLFGDIDIFENSDVVYDVVYSQSQNLINNEPSSEIHPINPPKSNLFENLLWINFISIPSATIRVSTLKQIGGYSDRFQIEDYPLWLELTKQNKKFYFRDVVTTYYRVHDLSFSISRKQSLDLEVYRIKLFFSPFSLEYFLHHLELLENAITQNLEYRKEYISEFNKKYGKRFSISIMKLFKNKTFLYRFFLRIENRLRFKLK